MATTMIRKVAAKQLGELLQEKQEPFILEVFLLERGYMRNYKSSEHSFHCCSGNSTMFLRRSAGRGLNKRRKFLPNCSKIIKAVVNKLVPIDIKLRMKNSERKDRSRNVTRIGENRQEKVEEVRFSSASSTTVFNSCSESDTEDTFNSTQKGHTSSTANASQSLKHGNLSQKEVAAKRNLQWTIVQDTKQHSPVSVLEDISSNESSPTARNGVKTSHEDFTDCNIPVPKSRSLCKLLVDPTEKRICVKEMELVGPIPSQYTKNNRALQQTKQLLFDCVREVIETHGRKQTGRQQLLRGFLGPEELGNLLVDSIWTWSMLPIDEGCINQLLNLDFSASTREWSEFQQQKWDISIEIGDAILGDVRDDIVTDMVIKNVSNISS